MEENFRLDNYNALWLLWLLPFLAGLYGYSFYRKGQALKQFADSEILQRINLNVSRQRQIGKAALLLAVALVIVAALTGPAWNPHPEKIHRKGRDIVILLDTSRSMLAEDIKPNRLERAKLAISDLMETLQGDRIGIIAFAGNAVVKCPLTQDYSFVRMILPDITPDSVGQGGTNIGDAIRKTTNQVFDQRVRDFKDIILITDGEDHDSFPVEAAKEAAQEGIRIFAIGLGNEKEGSRIPITGPNGEKTFLKYKGEEVWSILNGDALREIVFATPGGKYLNVATGNFNLAEIYQSLIATSERKELESTTILRYDKKFQIFLALALVLLVVEAMISERKKI
jgi:Ca-activated chloride channel family protein